MERLDTDLDEHFDNEAAQEDGATLEYGHFKLDDEYEVVVNKSLDDEITIDCEYFVVVETTYPVSELLSAVAEERFEGEIPDETTDCKAHHSDEDGDVGVAVEAWRDTDMDVDEAAETFAGRYE